MAVIKTFEIGGLVRSQNVRTKNLCTTRISARGNAETPLFGRGREGTGHNRSGTFMAGGDTCVPSLEARQWPYKKPRPAGQAVQRLTNIMSTYECCMHLGSTFSSY